MTIELFVALTKPTAAQLNAIGDNQVTLEAGYLGGAIERAAEEGGSTEDRYIIRHQYRWLLYSSTGALEDLTGTNDPVALSDEDILDLESVAWLAPGMFYRVTGCEYAMERRDAPNA